MSDTGQNYTLRQDRTQQREASAEASQAHHAAMQRIREGNAEVGRAFAEEFTALDDIGLESETVNLEELLDPPDTEIRLDDVDEVDETSPSPSPAPGGLGETYVIRCFGDRAVFQPPAWSLGWLPQAAVIEHSKRWRVCANLAAWLTKHHRRFLSEPSYLSFWESDELINGPDLPPVTCEGLYRATGCQEICDYTTFNRHVRETTLVWDTRHLPVAALFSRESKMAWCAAAIIARRQQHPFAETLLHNGLQSPKSSSADGRRLLALRSSPELLTPPKYVQLLCLMAGVAWPSVAARHGRRMFPDAP